MRASSDPLVSLAMLKVHMDRRGEDYIEHFVPFVAACLREAEHDTVSILDLQADLRARFGLRIPQSPLATILHRAVKHGYARRVEGRYRRNPKKLREIRVFEDRQRWLAEFARVAGRLVHYAEARFGRRLSHADAEAGLLRLVDDTTDLLADGMTDEPVVAVPLGADPGSHYVAGAFIRDALAKDDHAVIDLWESVVRGSMIASSLLYPDVAAVAQKFDRVRVFLDTRFLLRALGHCGPELQAAAREVLALLVEQKARLACFEDTLNEMQGVLDATARSVANPQGRGPSYGETTEFFLRRGSGSSDVELAIARLESDLRGLGVEVVVKPPYAEPLGIDEAGLEEAIDREISYRNRHALRHDVDVLASVHRLRGGKPARTLETCHALFVTTNAPLARAAARHFRAEHRERSVPPCVSVGLLATLVWLKSPQVAPDLPRKRIVADTYAALHPSDELWRAYCREIAKLRESRTIGTEDYSLLRYSSVARRHLMDTTFGAAGALTEGTVEEILERTKRQVVASKEAEVAEERRRRHDAERRAATTRAQMEQGASLVTARVDQLARRVAMVTRKGLQVASLAVLALGSWFALPFTVSARAGVPAPIIHVLVAVVVVAATMSLYRGDTVTGWLDRLEERIAAGASHRLRRLVQPANGPR